MLTNGIATHTTLLALLVAAAITADGVHSSFPINGSPLIFSFVVLAAVLTVRISLLLPLLVGNYESNVATLLSPSRLANRMDALTHGMYDASYVLALTRSCTTDRFSPWP